MRGATLARTKISREDFDNTEHHQVDIGIVVQLFVEFGDAELFVRSENEQAETSVEMHEPCRAL